MTRALRGYARLLARPGIGALDASQLISLLGTAVYELGVIWFTYTLTRSPALTGVVAAATFLPALVFVCDDVSYLLSAALLLRLPAGGPPANAAADRGVALVRGLARTAVHPALRGTYGLGALSSLVLVGAWIVGSPILAARMVTGSSLYPLLQAVYGAGVGLGAFAVGIALEAPGSERTVLMVGYILRAAGRLGLALARTVPMAVVTAFVTGLGIPTVTVTLPSLLQRAGRSIGRTGSVFGLYGLANAGVIGLSVVLYGAFAAAVPLSTVFLAAVGCALALVVLAPALLGAALPSKVRRTAPKAPTPPGPRARSAVRRCADRTTRVA